MRDRGVGARPGWLATIGFVAMLVVGSRAGAETLRGAVLDRAGMPVGGAIVWSAERYAPGPLAARETQTDDSGRFALQVKPGTWYVWARHDG
jgi:hypothetical protein